MLWLLYCEISPVSLNIFSTKNSLIHFLFFFQKFFHFFLKWQSKNKIIMQKKKHFCWISQTCEFCQDAVKVNSTLHIYRTTIFPKQVCGFHTPVKDSNFQFSIFNVVSEQMSFNLHLLVWYHSMSFDMFRSEICKKVKSMEHVFIPF